MEKYKIDRVSLSCNKKEKDTQFASLTNLIKGATHPVICYSGRRNKGMGIFTM